ncbi:hypothetical protein F4777DRAFT_592255 [Nemania sp. FL0916]|nr:hypothetical protein F4777DRAFT_592255 [Nemania sp. FL0916]
MIDLDGFSLVVGGGSGIGKACALAFAQAGTQGVMIADINLKDAETVAAECKQVSTRSGFRAEAVYIDVTLESSVKEAVAYLVATFQRVDHCVISAGIGVQDAKEMADADTAEFSRFFQVNVQGTFFVARDVSAAMKLQEPKTNDKASDKRGYTRGAIVILGSVASFLPQPRQIQYTASKHAVLGIARNAALDNIAYDIRVNCLCPSWVDTQMVRNALDTVHGLQQMIEGTVPMGRLAQPEEIADAAMFLCSPMASYMTGRLRRTVRHITGHDSKGQSVFLSTDCGDHHRIMGNNQAIANIIYSTKETPIKVNGDVDINYAKEHEPPLHCHNGSVVRMIDFGPGVESPLHRAISVDYGIVLEGEFELTLDSGETRIMRQGDISVQRATAHKWKNVTSNSTMPGRMVYILLDCEDVFVDGKKMDGFMSWLEPYYNKA